VSAECLKCGTDLVYAGEWPSMQCPVCVTKDELELYRKALVRIADSESGHWGRIAHEALREGRRLASSENQNGEDR
jgi:Zn ribbon nucleic-acid-binding protein